MTDATAFWLILFACAALMFFGTAAIITVVGTRDLRELLSKSGRNKKKGDKP